MRFHEREVATRGGPRRALVAEFTRSVVGRPAPEGEAQGIPLDPRTVLSAIRGHGKRIDMFVLRGTSGDGRGTWRLPHGLDEQRAARLAEAMFESHLPLQRELVREGVCFSLFVDWPRREIAAFRDGSDRLRRRLSQACEAGSASSEARLDLWLVRNLTFFFALPLDHVLTKLVPRTLPAFDARSRRIEELLDRLGLRAPKRAG